MTLEEEFRQHVRESYPGTPTDQQLKIMRALFMWGVQAVLAKVSESCPVPTLEPIVLALEECNEEVGAWLRRIGALPPVN